MSELANNTAALEAILSTVNSLPDAGDSSGSSLLVGDFTYTEEIGDEPGAYNYVLSSETINVTSRKLIVIFTRTTTPYSCVYKVLYRADLSDRFTEYYGTNDYVTHGMSVDTTDSTITIASAGINDDSFDAFWYIAV